MKEAGRDLQGIRRRRPFFHVGCGQERDRERGRQGFFFREKKKKDTEKKNYIFTCLFFRSLSTRRLRRETKQQAMNVLLLFVLGFLVTLLVSKLLNTLFPPECPRCKRAEIQRARAIHTEMLSKEKQSTDDLLDEILG